MTAPATSIDLLGTPIERGTTLIEASAGTGKTYCLTSLVLRLLLERHVESVRDILVMTFTIAATAELVERIRAVIREAAAMLDGRSASRDSFLTALCEAHTAEGPAILRRAMFELDELEVCTIHGFCRRVLEQSAFEARTPFDVEYVETDDALVERAAQDFWRRTVYPLGELFAAVASHRKLAPTSFLKARRDLRVHPDAVIDPEPLPLDEALARLEAAAASVRASWNRDEAVRRFASFQVAKKEGRPVFDVTARVEALRSFCEENCDTAVGAALDTCAAVLAKHVNKASGAGLASFALCKACDELAAAAAALEHSLRTTFLREIDAYVEREKRATGTASFDDLLSRLHDGLHDEAGREALRRGAGARFKAVLVDEFQDTDALQYEIFDTLFPNALLLFVGDAKQAIYRFRGADVFAYLRAKRSADRSYTLTRNWRSERPLVEAVSAIFARSARPFVHAEIPFEPVQGAGRTDEAPIHGDGRRALEWLWLGHVGNKSDGTDVACRATAHEIARLLARDAGVRIGTRPVEPRHIAVLTRTNDQAEAVQHALHEFHIPAVVSGAGNVFETEAAAELRILLRAVVAPGDPAAVRAALATRAWGFHAGAIAALGDGSQGEQEWQALVDQLEMVRATWTRRGFAAMSQRLLDVCDARRRLLAEEGGERRLTNFLHVMELAGHAAVAQHLSPDALLAWLAREIADDDRVTTEVTQLRMESDSDAVQIVTIHKSKGLEYEIVFCPFLWDGREPKVKTPVLVQLEDGRVIYDCNPELSVGRKAAVEAEELSENTRAAYVALTRAKHRCYVPWGSIGKKGSHKSALARLLHGDSSEADAHTWRAQLAELCARHPDSMSLRDAVTDPPPGSASQTSVERATLEVRTFPANARGRLVPWRVASFSSFRSGALIDASPDFSRDAGPAPVESSVSLELPDHGDPSVPAPGQDRAARGIFAFARGPRAGTCLHEILERCDFTRISERETETLVAECLRRHGLDRSQPHAGDLDPARDVLTMLDEVARSELPGAGFALAEVGRDERLSEWQFYVPMGGVSPARLAECFAAHGRSAIGSTYPASLRALGEREVKGFLMGFVDLVFRHGGRWFVLDWKSNHLGNRPEDYDDGAVARAMFEHHYVLQYHLYVLGLHRYLSWRLPAYEYERDFGGVYYPFLRGVRAGARTGWYADKPSRALIDALDTLVGREAST